MHASEWSPNKKMTATNATVCTIYQDALENIYIVYNATRLDYTPELQAAYRALQGALDEIDIHAIDESDIHETDNRLMHLIESTRSRPTEEISADRIISTLSGRHLHMQYINEMANRELGLAQTDEERNEIQIQKQARINCMEAEIRGEEL